MRTEIEPLTIRRYGRDDRAAVRRLHDEALYDAGAHLGPGPWDADLDDIENVYLNAGGEFLVGVLGGEVVAMGALRRASRTRADLTRMRVAPRLQGRGMGQSLLEALHDRARDLGYATVRLETTVHQVAARGLYERNGYREVGRGVVGAFRCVQYERDLVG